MADPTRYQEIPYRTIASYFGRLPAELPIVSVGCGPGTTEWKLKHKYGLGDRRWILVDPAPESFQKYPPGGHYSLRVDADLVKNLIQKEPNLVGNCVLFLPWPSPNDDAGNYDMEAVILLHPKAIILVFETVGSAGSHAMHTWLSTFGESEQHLLRSKSEMEEVAKNVVLPPSSWRYIPRMRHTNYCTSSVGRLSPRVLLLQLEYEAAVVVEHGEENVEENLQHKGARVGCVMM